QIIVRMDSQAAKAAFMLTNTLRGRRGDRSTLEAKRGARTHRTPKALRGKSWKAHLFVRRPPDDGSATCLPSAKSNGRRSDACPKCSYACAGHHETCAKLPKPLAAAPRGGPVLVSITPIRGPKRA